MLHPSSFTRYNEFSVLILRKTFRVTTLHFEANLMFPEFVEKT